MKRAEAFQPSELPADSVPGFQKAELVPGETVVVRATPFLAPEQFESMTAGAEAVVMIAFASGTIPERLIPVLDTKAESGVPVFLLSDNRADKHGIVKVVYSVQANVARAGAIALERVNVNHVEEVLTAIAEERTKGLSGSRLGEAIRERFAYGDEPKPLPEWERPQELRPEAAKEQPLRLQEVLEGEPGYEEALVIRVAPGATREEVEKKVRERLVDEHWYLQDYWREREPKEKITITAGPVTVEAYNFHEPLEEWQYAELQAAVGEYARLRNNSVFEQVRHILIDAKQPINPQNGEEMNGYAGMDGAIKLYPRALKADPHRVAGVSNLEGTVIHELSHRLGGDFQSAWAQEFGWTTLEDPEPLPGGTELRYFVNVHPERCVTAYAAVSPAEDICESMVAAMKNPSVLDADRYQRLREAFLPLENAVPVAVTIKVEREDISLPVLEQPVRYKRVAKKMMAIGP